MVFFTLVSVLLAVTHAAEEYAIKDGVKLVEFESDDCAGESDHGTYDCGPDTTFRYDAGLHTSDFVIETEFKPQRLGNTQLGFRIEIMAASEGENGALYFVGLDGKNKQFFVKSNDGEWPMQTFGTTTVSTTEFQTLRLERSEGVLAVLLDGTPIPGMEDLPLEVDVDTIGWRALRTVVEIKSLSTNMGPVYPACIKDGFRTTGRAIGTWKNVPSVDDCSSGCLMNERCEVWSYDSKKLRCQLVESWPPTARNPPAGFKAGKAKMQSGNKACSNGEPKPLPDEDLIPNPIFYSKN